MYLLTKYVPGPSPACEYLRIRLRRTSYYIHMPFSSYLSCDDIVLAHQFSRRGSIGPSRLYTSHCEWLSFSLEAL